MNGRRSWGQSLAVGFGSSSIFCGASSFLGGVLAQDGDQLGLQLGHPLLALLGDPDRIFAAVGYRKLGLKPFPLFQEGNESAGCGLSEAKLFPDGRLGRPGFLVSQVEST